MKKLLLALLFSSSIVMASHIANDDLLNLATAGKSVGTNLEMNKDDMVKADGGWYSIFNPRYRSYSIFNNRYTNYSFKIRGYQQSRIRRLASMGIAGASSKGSHNNHSYSPPRSKYKAPTQKYMSNEPYYYSKKTYSWKRLSHNYKGVSIYYDRASHNLAQVKYYNNRTRSWSRTYR